MEQDAVLPTGHPNNANVAASAKAAPAAPWYTNKWFWAAVVCVIIGIIVVVVYFSTKPKSTVPVKGIPPPPNATASKDKTKEEAKKDLIAKVASDPNTPQDTKDKAKAQMEMANAKGSAMVKVAAEAPAPAGGPLDGYMAPVNIDYPYNDLGNFPTSDPTQCAQKCNDNAQCKLFVTANDSQNCWIKSDAQNKTPSAARNTYAKKGFNLP